MNALQKSARRTKAIWSLEAPCFSEELFQSVPAEEYDALRLVYQPERITEMQAFIKMLRKQRKDIPIMLDAASTVRAVICELDQPLEVAYGQELSLGLQGSGKGDLQVNTKVWSSLFREDALVFVGYGYVVLKVKSVADTVVTTEVLQGGTIYPDIDIHVPATKPRVTAEDVGIEDLEKLINLGIDYFVLPGLVDKAELASVKQKIKAMSDTPPWLILKIDSEHVLNCARDLIEDVDGLLISRLDMALTVDPAVIPIITKEVIQAANSSAKLVFTASEMLGSMRHNATPTRAEVSDIANAVLDGTDAVVLSEEVSYGPYAARAIRLMSRTISDIEEQSSVHLNWIKHQPEIRSEMDAVAFTAYKTAERVGAKALVCITMSGNTPMSLSSYRAPVPIISVTFSEHVYRRFALMRGVQGIVLDAAPRIDEVLPLVNDRLVRDSWLEVGDRIVFVSVTLSSLGREASNLFTIQTLA